MEDGRWKMEDGRSEEGYKGFAQGKKMEKGRGKMEDGRWKKEEGKLSTLPT